MQPGDQAHTAAALRDAVGVRLPAGLPAAHGEVLLDFCDAAVKTFGVGLRALLLFGSAAEGRVRPTSDVNVMVVLRTFAAESARRFAPHARLARAAVRLNAMYVMDLELPELAEMFPVKVADIRARHVVLVGDDPLASLAIDPDALRRQVREIMLDTSLRLRAALMLAGDEEERLRRGLSDAVSPLRAGAAALCGLRGERTVSPKAALERICVALGVRWERIPGALASVRAGQEVEPGRMVPLALDAAALAEAIGLEATEKVS